jgi:hypothetical protein
MREPAALRHRLDDVESGAVDAKNEGPSPHSAPR